MRNLFVMVALLCAFLFALGNRLAALNLYWFIAIFRPQDWIFFDLDALRISLLAGVLAVGGCLVTGHLPRIQGPNGWLMLAFLGLGIAGHFTVGCTVSLEWLDSLARTILLLFFTDRLITTPRRFVIVVFIIAFSLGFHSSKGGLAALLSGGNQYGISNLKGSFSGSNAFALGTAVIVFFMLMANARLEMVFDKWLLDEKGEVKPWVRHLKIAGLGAIAFSAFNVMSLHSRGSFLALAGGLFIFVAFRPNGFRRMMLILPLLGITLLVVPLPDGFSERIASAFADEEDRETSAASRPHFWGVGVNMAVSNPFGVGLGCFNEHYDRYDPTEGEWGSGRSVHSSHFQVASETGVPGAIIWILLFCSSLLQCQVVRIRSRHLSLTPAQAAFLEYNAIALICGMLTFIVGGMFYALALIELPWMMFVLSGALNRISKEMIEEAVVTERVEEESGETDAPRRSIYERHV